MALPRKSVPTVVIPRQIVDRLAYAAGTWKPNPPPPDSLSLLQYDPSFANVIGDTATSTLLERQPSVPLYSQGCVYISGSYFGSHNELFITSNLLARAGSTEKTVLISHLSFHRNEQGGIASRTYEKFYPTAVKEGTALANPSGGTAWKDGVVWCSQGDTGSGVAALFYIPHGSKYAQPLLTNFMGKPFNSPYNVVCGPDRALWFTDPWHQEIRPNSVLPPGGVYRFDPQNGVARLLADGFVDPRGIAFSKDTLVVADAGDPATVGGGGVIYAFQVQTHGGQSFVTNKRVFAMLDTGPPGALRCDVMGNVFVGCGDGMHVFSIGGVLIGKILVPEGGVGGFCFGMAREMFICNETRLWRVQTDGFLVHGVEISP